MKKITFITGNIAKAEQLGKYLGIPVDHHKLDLTEIQSLDLNEVTTHKVQEAYNTLKVPVLVDDVSLVIHSMGNLPGPFVKFFIGELGNQGICDLVKNFKNKSATATVAIGLHDGKNVKIFLGLIKGKISNKAKGNGGFGWDQIFVPDGYSQTRSEMNETDYDDTSPRKFALEKLSKYLRK